MPLNLNPHVWDSSQKRIVKVDPYIRLSYGESYKNAANKECFRKFPPIFLQKGRYYSQDGKEIASIPQWARDEVAKISPEALTNAGFTRQRKNDLEGRQRETTQ